MNWIKEHTVAGYLLYTFDYKFGKIYIEQQASTDWIVYYSTRGMEMLKFSKHVRLEEMQTEAIYYLAHELSNVLENVYKMMD
jgi:hypothetical protein